MGFINKLTKCFRCAEKKALKKVDLEPVLHFFPYPHIEMEPSIHLNYDQEDDDDDDDDDKKEKPLKKENSYIIDGIIDPLATFWEGMHPRMIIHRHLVDYYHWQIEVWKKRLYYPYSMYAGAAIVTGIALYFSKKCHF